MDIVAAVLLALAGLIAGFLAGVFGIGGGIVLVPVLLYYCRSAGVSSLVATHVAMGTSLLVVMFISGTQTWGYWRANQAIWRGAVLVALAGVLGADATGAGLGSGFLLKDCARDWRICDRRGCVAERGFS